MFSDPGLSNEEMREIAISLAIALAVVCSAILGFMLRSLCRASSNGADSSTIQQHVTNLDLTLLETTVREMVKQMYPTHDNGEDDPAKNPKIYKTALDMLVSEQGAAYVNVILTRELAQVLKHNAETGYLDLGEDSDDDAGDGNGGAGDGGGDGGGDDDGASDGDDSGSDGGDDSGSDGGSGDDSGDDSDGDDSDGDGDDGSDNEVAAESGEETEGRGTARPLRPATVPTADSEGENNTPNLPPAPQRPDPE